MRVPGRSGPSTWSGWISAPIRQGDGFTVHQVAPPGTGRDVQLVGFFGQEGAACFFLEEIAEAVRTTVPDREGGDGEIIFVEDQPAVDLQELQVHGWLGTAQHDAVDQVVDAVQRPLTTVDLQLVDRLPAHEGGKQARPIPGCGPGDHG